MPKVFVSYSRADEGKVNNIVQDIEALGHDVWFDNELSGGQNWWERILQEIRQTDIFVFILSPASRKSSACSREYKYAHALHKPILPLQVKDGVSINLLPPALSQIQIVSYLQTDKNAVIRLVRALGDITSFSPLPDPLPEPPVIPVSYLGTISEQIESNSSLSYEKQSVLLLDIKKCLRDSDINAKDAILLLKNFRNRRDILLSTAEEIDILLKKIESYEKEVAELKAKQEEERKVKEAAELKAKQEKERKAKEAAELKAKQEKERKAREVAELKAKQEEERKAREAAELKAKKEEERKAREAAELKAKQEEKHKAREAAELKAKQEEERKVRDAAELKAKQEEERRVKEAAELKAKKEEERKVREATELKAKQEEERRVKEAAELKAKQEEECRAKEAAELKAKRKAEREKRNKKILIKIKNYSRALIADGETTSDRVTNLIIWLVLLISLLFSMLS